MLKEEEMFEEVFSNNIQKEMLSSSVFCNLLFDEEMDAEQIKEMIKEKESGDYRCSRMSDNCRIKLINYAIEKGDDELLEFMWTYINWIEDVSKKHEVAEKILKI